MQDFIITLLTCSVTMSVLALFYMVVTPLLSKRYSVKGRYYAWLVIVIGLIIPFRPQFNNAIVTVDVPSETASPIIQIGNGTPVAIPALVENASFPSVLSTVSWWQFAAMVWLTGVIAFLVYHGIKHYRFMKMARRWSENITDERTLTLLQNLKSEMGISKQTKLYLCSCIGSPMMIGFINPRILLPKAALPQDELRFIFKHELVHYKRKDLLYKYLVLAATAIHWFNPIFYLMAKAIDVLCEISCDAEVVRSTDADTRQHYSETIIGIVKYQSKLKTALSTNFYGGKKGMKNRVASIMDTGKKKAGVAIIALTLIVTMGTGFAFAANAGNHRTVILESTSKTESGLELDNAYAYAYELEVFADEEVSISGVSKVNAENVFDGYYFNIQKGQTFYISYHDLPAGSFTVGLVNSDGDMFLADTLLKRDGDELSFIVPETGKYYFYSKGTVANGGGRTVNYYFDCSFK